ncbi:MAG: hypothetical protein PWQ79_214 [Thermococcaceae archaeon]|nr:hypothetical protein [Thermococcaceae archaeon]MDK2913299.1 hypothetical protein [Thermococcaceae archaeon]
MDNRIELRLIEYGVETILVAWLSYLFFYQNYLLYKWHRGLPMPPKWPFVLIGIAIGVLFLWYELNKMEKELGKNPLAVLLSTPEPINNETPEEGADNPLERE